MALPARDEKPIVLITGCSGLIGSRLAEAAADEYRVVGFDNRPPEKALPLAEFIACDLTSDADVTRACDTVKQHFGPKITSVVHLAAYYDFSGEPSPLYRDLTVEGTRRLLHQLWTFKVEQLVFSSSLLVMKPAEEDELLTAASPTEARWDYPRSKLMAEKVIRDEHGDIPSVILRIAGVYDEDGHSIPIAQQISRIHQQQLESYFFPGDKSHGQAFVHLDDLVDCILLTIERRNQLDSYEVFLIGEEDVMSYAELQEHIGTLLHGKAWPTLRIPKPLAKAGAWAKSALAGDEEKQFIKPWMIDLADQHYPVSGAMARQKLGWRPQHSLRHTLPEMISRLRRDPHHWYEINGLPQPESMPELHEVGASHD